MKKTPPATKHTTHRELRPKYELSCEWAGCCRCRLLPIESCCRTRPRLEPRQQQHQHRTTASHSAIPGLNFLLIVLNLSYSLQSHQVSTTKTSGSYSYPIKIKLMSVSCGCPYRHYKLFSWIRAVSAVSVFHWRILLASFLSHLLARSVVVHLNYWIELHYSMFQQFKT